MTDNQPDLETVRLFGRQPEPEAQPEPAEAPKTTATPEQAFMRELFNN